MSYPLLVGHLVSGGGTTMDHVAREMLDGKLGNIIPAVVIADRDCDALGKATALKISNATLPKASFGDKQEWDAALERILLDHKVDIVFQNGWTPITPRNVVNRWNGSIYNQHPGPLSGNGKPDFGGRGMCGTAVTAARILYLLETGENDPEKLTTESTVHMVTPGLDDGRLVRIQHHNIAGMIELFRDKGISTIDSANANRETFNRLVGQTQKDLLAIEHLNVSLVLSERARGIRLWADKDERATHIDTDILEQVKAAATKMYPTK